MLSYSGKSAYSGIAIGKIKVISDDNSTIKRLKIHDTDAEIKRFLNALTVCDKEIEKLYEKSLQEIGTSNASIFEIHRMMLKDNDYIESIENIIKSENVNSEYAVSVTCDNFEQIFLSMDDEYMKARAGDIKDISSKLIAVLQNREISYTISSNSTIIVANDLSPSQTVSLDKTKVDAFVTKSGSSNSHTAILARTMNIPSIVQCDFDDLEKLDNRTAIVDGFRGKFIIDPDEATIKEMKKQKLLHEEKQKLLESLKGKKSITKDGKHIKLYANIGTTQDLPAVLENDADGIGLLRSEFLYLGRTSCPTEEEQYNSYKRIIQTMAGKPIIIRTLDIGADKNVDYFNIDREDNPALGYRAIRLCLDQQDIFKTQIRAILRAAAYGDTSIMYPMITSIDEIKKAKEITAQMKEELQKESIPYGNVSEGIMIETPAAAIISDMLAPEVDFFSIGTNDLSQYTLAIDRQNPKLDSFFDPYHPAILRLIKTVTDNAHKHGIWVGICGELGADTEMTSKFLKMGIDELSVSPNSILPIRKIIIQSNSI